MNQQFITNDIELHHRIMKLNNLKEEQEIAIKRNVREFAYSLHPAMILKHIVGKFTEDSETNDSIKSFGLNLGKDFLLSKLFGKGVTLKGFLSSFLIGKVADYFIKRNPDLIANGINKLENFISSRRPEIETEDE